MRIALVYRAFHRGGSLPRTSVALARHLSARHEVHVFSIPERTDRALAPACSFHDVPVPSLGDGATFSARELIHFARNAAALLAADTYDVVHVCAPSTWVGDVLHVPGIARAEAADQGLSTLRFAATTARHPGNAARLVIERRAMRSRTLRRVHVAAPSVRDDVIRHYGVDPAAVVVVLPAVDLAEFRPGDRAAARVELGLEPERFLLLFAGSDFHRKGLDRAIDALAASSVDAELLVLGGGATEPFRRRASAAGVEGRVRFIGSHPRPADVYRAADVLLLPTRSDVWGITPIEALACAVPVIVSAAAGSSAVIRDGETGIVLPEPFELRDLRAAIDRLGTDPDLRHRMGLAGFQDAQAHSAERRGRLVEDDLIRLAGERGRARAA